MQHSWRSLDNFCFSSQYYFIISLTTWGIIFLYLGITTMLRNSYNPFADPVFLWYIGLIIAVMIPIRFILRMISVRLWEVQPNDLLKVDI